MRGRIEKDDYVGFTYAGIHSSQFGLKSVTSGDRYQRYLSPEFTDITAQKNGGDGINYFGVNRGKKVFNFNIAFDTLTESEYREMLVWLNLSGGDLVFDETPYIKYSVKIGTPPTINFLVFLDENNKRVYKGEGAISFTCYEGFGRNVSKWYEDYSQTGFIEKSEKQDIFISESVTEWVESSKLLPSIEYQDRLYDTLLSDNTIYMYNPGDYAVPFKLTIPASSNFITLSLETYNNEITSQTGFMKIEGLPVKDEHSIVIDSELRLIYGFDNNNPNKIYIYNDFWKEGNYIILPTNNGLTDYSILKLEADSIFDSKKSKIEYEYRYL